LNHLPAKLIRTYDRNTYAAEKRDALERWASHLALAVVQATGANVTTLRKGLTLAPLPDEALRIKRGPARVTNGDPTTDFIVFGATMVGGH